MAGLAGGRHCWIIRQSSWLSIGDLERLAAPVTLVLDDYHLISNPSLLECVAHLVEHLPATLCLVVSARSDPVLLLARLRARDEMTEIRAARLRFTDDEAAELLNGTLGLALAQEDIDTLQRRTEGWAAGLYLASLSLRGRPDPSRLVRAFAGDRPGRRLPRGRGARRAAGRRSLVHDADFIP